jgi:hypothetical protein
MNVHTDARESPIGHARRLRGTVIGFGAGAVVAVALSQLATAPTAHADDFTDVFDNVQFVIGQGQGQLAAAAADFANSEPANGLSMAIAGVDNLGVAAEEDALAGTIDALLGHTPYETSFGLFPSGLATISEGHIIFADALTDFGNADFVEGLALAFDASNDINVVAPDLLFLGLVDSLMGL